MSQSSKLIKSLIIEREYIYCKTSLVRYRNLQNCWKKSQELHKLSNFLRAVYDKKLVGGEGKRRIATYIQSFEDTLGDQVNNALRHDVSRLMRYVEKVWPNIQKFNSITEKEHCMGWLYFHNLT